MTRRFASLAVLASLLVVSGAQAAPASGTWSYAGKTGIGTAYADYGPSRAASRVWFSIAHGVLTETMYGLIHQAQLREVSFAVKGADFLAFEDQDVNTRVAYLKTDAAGRPRALDYRIVNRDRQGRYTIEKDVFTDPKSDTVFMRVTVRAGREAVTPYLLADPQMASTSGGDEAEASSRSLSAFEGPDHLAIRASQPFTVAAAGIAGVSDGWTVLKRKGRLEPAARAGRGDVTLAGQFAPVPAGGEATYDVVLGFGPTDAAAEAAAKASLARGYAKVRADYEGGWADYLAKLGQLPRLSRESTDGGKLLYASAMVLKAQEDKTYPGALIASLSTPWGDTLPATTVQTGYKAVWPRDFYQVASALLALGDRETPLKALDYLKTVQVRPDTPGNHGASGWFLQKTHVDGVPEWTGVQLDQTAMPIMLAEKLWRQGLISGPHLQALYRTSLKPAADFLTKGGHVDFAGNQADVTPPKTPMERWEEQPGFSPSTTAAEITGLVAAAQIAQASGDPASAKRYLASADAMEASVERTTFTTKGVYGDGRYFERISPDGDPNSGAVLLAKNGKPALPQQRYLDAGFLELVRYGVRRADAPSIRESLGKLDDESLPDDMRVRYDFRFPGDPGVYPGWRRYSDDGYGEDDKTGAGFGSVGPDGKDTPDQRGRVWPIFTGERGHYEIALATLHHPLSAADRRRIRYTYVRAMEHFANPGLMLPEQVYDGVGASGGTEPPGQGTG
ncbi:MAG: glucan 1,4-alpha-glucosidase, partial [Alphaproteobacteria bacterium]|nr:glucan 1,4-alpha-glucosidase [Alphaproteobacteria bacterium]